MKLIISLSTLAFALAFNASTDEVAVKEMNRLAQENALLLNKVDSLQKKLDSLNAYSDSVKKSLEKLDMHP